MTNDNNKLRIEIIILGKTDCGTISKKLRKKCVIGTTCTSILVTYQIKHCDYGIVVVTEEKILGRRQTLFSSFSITVK